MIGVLRRTDPEPALRAALAQKLQHSLQGSTWQVMVEPVIGSVIPDFLLKNGSGNACIIEVKAAPSGASFGSVLQAASFRDAVAAQLDCNVDAVLVIAGGDGRELELSSKDFGIRVIATRATKPSEVAGVVVEQLDLATQSATS
jgi:hypothetical protein